MAQSVNISFVLLILLLLFSVNKIESIIVVLPISYMAIVSGFLFIFQRAKPITFLLNISMIVFATLESNPQADYASITTISNVSFHKIL